MPPTTLADSGAAPTVSEARTMTSWDAARRDLAGLPGGRGLNIAHEAVDRHAAGPAPGRLALRCIARDGAIRDFTYADLRRLTNRFANVLVRLGVAAGDRVFLLAGRIPELSIALLGALKQRAICAPLFAAFGPEPIRARLEIGQARVLVTTRTLYERKVAPVRDRLPFLEHVILVGDIAGAPSGVLGWDALMVEAKDEFSIEPTAPEDPALLHFTSGTTGTPKGALHVHDAVVAHRATGQLALDLRPGDVYWCTADPGWVTGTSYGIVAPLSLGVTSIVDEADYDLDRWCRILSDQRVTVWYTAPTAIRMMMKGGTAAVRQRSYPALRFLASVGEPLNPDAVRWGQAAFDHPFHDNWWQTETGAIMIANVPGMEIRPGSMGRPVPGIAAAIVRRREDGGVDLIREPGQEGEIALRPGWPSMFRGYWNEPERYARCFADGFYLTGDLARQDSDGYFWFVGRSDDVIKTSGHLIGPFEVESVLLSHPAVAEAGVIGKPDPVALELVKAFVSLKDGYADSEVLRRELLGFARARLGAVVAPKEIAVLPSLPRTRSGKIMRRLLKARELGLPEGDTSTLEGAG